MKRYVVFYHSAPGVASNAPAHFSAHEAWYKRFAESGELLGVGIFADPQNEGAMGIFASREAAEEFARSDPFVVNGVVERYEIREWNDVLS